VLSSEGLAGRNDGKLLFRGTVPMTMSMGTIKLNEKLPGLTTNLIDWNQVDPVSMINVS